MKKLNFIIGKRHIMISTLLLILAVAAYLNWQFATSEQSISVMDVLNPKKTQNSPQLGNLETDGANYGEAELVSNEVQAYVQNDEQNETKTDYFAQARMQKDASRAETKEELQKTKNLPSTSPETRAEAERQDLNLTTTERQEKAIESQVKANGFSDCVTYVTNQNTNSKDTPDPKVNVIVKTEQMTPAQAAAIKDIVVNVTKAKPINITVTPVA